MWYTCICNSRQCKTTSRAVAKQALTTAAMVEDATVEDATVEVATVENELESATAMQVVLDTDFGCWFL
jgi:acid phosphatase class B